MLMSGFAGHIDSWLAIARHEQIDQLEKSNGYHSCDAQLWKVVAIGVGLVGIGDSCTGHPRYRRGIMST